MRVRWRALATGVLAAASAAGCNGAGLVSGSGIPYAQYWRSLAAANCHLEAVCGRAPDQASCLSAWQPGGTVQDTLDLDVASGKVIYHGDAAQTCIDAINAQPCTYSGMVDDPACSRIFTGTIALGSSSGCFLDEECADPGYCAGGYYPCGAGTCQPVVPAQLGDPCGHSGDQACAPGLACAANFYGYGTCQVPAGPGGACEGSGLIPCTGPFYCDGATNTCMMLAATNAPCTASFNNNGSCDDLRDFCDYSTGVCTRIPGAGSPCNPDSTGYCLPYAYCDTTTNTCVPRPTVGQPCDPAGQTCIDSTCDSTSNTCVPYPVAGGACPS